MKDTYFVRDPDKGVFAAAIADVVLMPTGSSRRRHYVITRINVMEQYRGQGFGTKVLDLILADADVEGITLFLEPVASGALDKDELIAWYERHGFDWGAWHMVRRPQPTCCEECGEEEHKTDDCPHLVVDVEPVGQYRDDYEDTIAAQRREIDPDYPDGVYIQEGYEGE